jgi:response regulator RpfG family c-di-GMP phosphodiesterase
MRLARSLAEELLPDGRPWTRSAIAALLRDIGKAGVGPDVLQSEGGLDEHQMRELQGIVRRGPATARAHRLSLEGPPRHPPPPRALRRRGYPDGLKGREIPIGSRILAVIDAYQAMVSDRPTAWRCPGRGLRRAGPQRGHQFDPRWSRSSSHDGEEVPGKARNRKFRILVADHNEEFRNLLKLRLVNDNYEVDVVSSVDDAMDKLMGRGADIVLADARPAATTRSSSSARCARTRRCGRSRSSSCRIGTTAFSRCAPSAGVDDFVVKNVDLAEMVARVENVLTPRVAAPRRHAREAPPAASRARLETMALPDILQTLQIGMKTGARHPDLRQDHGHGSSSRMDPSSTRRSRNRRGRGGVLHDASAGATATS